MKNKKFLRPWVVNLITLILLGVIIFSGYNIYKIKSEENKTAEIQNEYKFVEAVDTDETSVKYRERYNQLKEINADFKGWIVFESGLIDLPFVQYSDNDYYLNRDIYQKKSTHGTVFQDYLQSLDDKNITLYGHYVYNNPALMFTPLATLTDQTNYDANKCFYLYLENTVRKYEVVAVVKYIDTDFPIYQVGNLNEEEFNQYKEYIDINQVYDTGVEINYEDSLISLQTCVRNEKDTRWLVVGKLISEENVE